MARHMVRTKISLDLLHHMLHLSEDVSITHVYQEDPYTATLYLEGQSLPEVVEGGLCQEAMVYTEQAKDGKISSRIEVITSGH